MIKQILSSAVLLAVTMGAHAQYNSQIPNLSDYSGIGSYRNLVRTYVPQQGRSEAADFNLQQSPGKSLISSNYFDGLGRPVEEISNGISPHGNIANVHVYDGKGREAVKCLPFLAQDLRLAADPLSRINGIYSTLYNGDHPYGQTLYDNSPLDRTVLQRAPGAAWIGAGRGVRTDYGANTATDNVIRWNPASPGASAGTYDAHELQVITTTDEDGKMVRTFTDGFGRVVCKRSALTLYTQVPYQPMEWAQTYYVYNLLGRLVAVLSPEAVKNNPGSLSPDVVNGLCYTYTYDERGRLTMKRLPGKEPEYYIYDSRDRQVAYQDGQLKAGGKWFFTVFDGMDRPLTTGLYTTANTPEQLSYLMGNGVAYTAYGSGNLMYYLKNTDIQRNPLQPGSAISGCQLQTLNYYDDYNYSPYSVSGYNTSLDSRLPAPDVYIPAAVKADMPKGLPTINAGREQLPDGTFGAWHTSFSFYDTKNNLIQTQQENVNGITDILTMRYDFNGRLRYRVGQYANSLTATPADQQKVTISESFNLYTNSSLPSIATFRINDGPYMAMSYKFYDRLGRDSNTKLAYDALSGGGFDQVYSYNIRNWLTGINGGHVDDYTPAGVFGPFFSERLNYDKVSLLSPVTPCYNGNIAAMEWKMSGRERKHTAMRTMD